jgi:hypothetical protein
VTEAADDLSAIRSYNRKRGPVCQAGLVLAAMDPDIRRSVDLAVADPTIERKAIVAWLETTKGIVVSPTSFTRHVAGECRCG